MYILHSSIGRPNKFEMGVRVIKFIYRQFSPAQLYRVSQDTLGHSVYSNRPLHTLGYSLIFTTIIFIITTDLVLLSGRWDSSLRG
jgi:hypothetical protein